MIKNIIIITGNAGSAFFLNELKFVGNYYDAVYIIDFSGDQAIGDWIAEKYGYNYINCKMHVLQTLRWSYIRDFASWLNNDYVRKEIAQNIEASIIFL